MVELHLSSWRSRQFCIVMCARVCDDIHACEMMGAPAEAYTNASSEITPRLEGIDRT